MLVTMLIIGLVIALIIIGSIAYIIFYFSLTGYTLINENVSKSYFYTPGKRSVEYIELGNRFELGGCKFKGVEVDVDTFVPIHEHIAKDKNNVYIACTPAKVDVNDFAVLNGMYAKDSMWVYMILFSGTSGRLRTFEKADPKTFTALEDSNPWRAKDANHVYSQDYAAYSSKIISQKNLFPADYVLDGADPATFKIIENKWAKDKNAAYFMSKAIPGADPLTFDVLDYSHVEDKNFIYWGGFDGNDLLKMPQTNPKSFTLLGRGYSKDVNGIYYFLKKISGADVDTFEVVPDERGSSIKLEYDARDKTYKYQLGERVG